ncbi:hypothetical protein KIN20_003058 [Parelaphostrongylus tenuis]|uniref:Uncharacterized protein n=1 Tax=Parelaphostrongylus tenuis TaxID=148309 RepID=A0AAD5QH61_PARTN|nr:hypothetical protein KIN20_003058 [Parelaphostrongylus tenuis]
MEAEANHAVKRLFPLVKTIPVGSSWATWRNTSKAQNILNQQCLCNIGKYLLFSYLSVVDKSFIRIFLNTVTTNSIILYLSRSRRFKKTFGSFEQKR